MEETKQTKEPTMEDYKQALIEMQRRNNALEQRLGGIDMVSLRLNYLFAVIKNSTIGWSDGFVDNCITEIEDLLTIKQEGEGENAEDQ